MLAPLAFVLAAPQGFVPLSYEARLAKVEALVRKAGYVVTMGRAGGGIGTISRGGRRARFRLLGNGYDGSAVLGPNAAALQLTTEFGVARELPQIDVPFALGGLLPRGKTLFAPSLGRTVQALADVVVLGAGAPPSPKRDLDRYFADVDAYARAHGGTGGPPPSRDWRRAPLGDDVLVYRYDPVSLRRLLRGWGFASPLGEREPWWGDVQTWSRVGGRDVVLTKPLGEDRNRAMLSLSADLKLPRGADREAWLRSHARAARPLTFGRGGPGGAYVTQDVSFSPPMRAGELRKRIVDFARRAAALTR